MARRASEEGRPMDHTRQADLLPPGRLAGLHVDLVGAGSVGTLVGLTLARLGVPAIRAFDDDWVESVNLPTQLFRLEDARRRAPKVQACKAIWESFSDVHVEAIPEQVERQT